MTLELKLRKVGNSLGIVLPKEALAQLKVGEGDTVCITEAPEDGIQVRASRVDFAKKMAVVDKLCRKYRNALRELSK